jgi:hypothetical protein
LRHLGISYNADNKVGAIELLDNPTILLGAHAAPYVMMFYDNVGDSPLQGGITCIYGYTYGDNLYGSQMAIKHSSAPAYRGKANGTWSPWQGL